MLLVVLADFLSPLTAEGRGKKCRRGNVTLFLPLLSFFLQQLWEVPVTHEDVLAEDDDVDWGRQSR